jgi:phage gpG-like protein
MSGAEIRLELRGLVESERHLAFIAGRLDDLEPLMDIFGTTVESDVHDNFLGEHTPEGVPWPPSIRVQEHGGKTLQLSRRLFQSITHRASRSSVEIGTNVVYAGRHNDGFKGTEQVASHKRTMRQVFGVALSEPIEVIVPSFAREANTPRRQFLGVSPAARAELVDQAEDYLAAPAP